MQLRTQAMLSVLALLAGCTSYQPKPGEKVAKLRFAVYTSDASSIAVKDVRACPSPRQIIFHVVSNLTDPQPKLGMAGTPESLAQRFAEFVIPADVRLPVVIGSTVAPNQYVSGYTCRVGVVFDVKADSEYEVQYHYIYGSGKCDGRVFELKQRDGNVERVRVDGAAALPANGGTDICGLTEPKNAIESRR